MLFKDSSNQYYNQYYNNGLNLDTYYKLAIDNEFTNKNTKSQNNLYDYMNIQNQAYLTNWNNYEKYKLPFDSFVQDDFIGTFVKNLFAFYIKSEFSKTKTAMKIFFKELPEARNFLSAYNQIITTNYNDYSFIKRNVINIHGKIDDENQPIIWYDKNVEKKLWSELEKSNLSNIKINSYTEMDIMGLSLKNDENTLKSIFMCSEDNEDLTLNYYYYSNTDKKYFKKLIDKYTKENNLRIIDDWDSNDDQSSIESIKFKKQLFNRNTIDNWDHRGALIDHIAPSSYNYYMNTFSDNYVLVNLKDCRKSFWGIKSEEANEILNK